MKNSTNTNTPTDEQYQLEAMRSDLDKAIQVIDLLLDNVSECNHQALKEGNKELCLIMKGTFNGLINAMSVLNDVKYGRTERLNDWVARFSNVDGNMYK